MFACAECQEIKKEFTNDRTGICLGMDMTISAYYFGIFKIIMHPFWSLQLIFTKELES